MIKEIIEELHYAIKHPVQTLLVVGMFSGIIPAMLVALIEKNSLGRRLIC